MNKMASKRLLILGGMRLSCEIVDKAREMGVTTVVADYNEPENSPAKRIADEHYPLNITDVDAVVEFIKEKHIDGVIVGFNDMLLPYYADICERSNLPCYGNKEQFELLTDKKLYKSLCKEFGVPVIEEYDESSPDIKYPVIVKPTDDSGSRGIYICYNHDELAAGIEKAKQRSKSGSYIIERYIDAEEVTVFWVFQDGKHYLSAVADRHIKKNGGKNELPQPVGYTFPSKYLQNYRKEVEENAKRMFRHINIKDGMLFMQCKIENGTALLYDMGYRLTGSLEYKVLDRVCGYDPLRMMIAFALTGSMSEPQLEQKVEPDFPKAAFNVSCLCKQGTIERYAGLDDVLKMPEVIDVAISHEAGESITPEMIGRLSQIGVRILGCVETKADLYPAMNRINKTIRIISDTGEDLLLPGIEEKDIAG